MGTTFPLGGDLQWFEQIIDLGAGFFGKLVESGETQLADVEERWPIAQANGDPEYLEHLSDIGAEASDFVKEAADLAIVGMYHWVERSMKNVLIRVLHGLGQPYTPVARMDGPTLRSTFVRAGGINFANIAHEDSVTTLRLFANSWKHNADFVADALCQDLGLAVPSTYSNHLAESAVRDAMGAKIGLQAGCSAGDVVRGYAPAAAAFAKALANACP